MPGGGSQSTKTDQMPWSKYVPEEVYSAFKEVLPQLQAKYDVGLTPEEKSYYAGQAEAAIGNQTAGQLTNLRETAARSGINGGALMEGNSDVARNAILGQSSALSNIMGTDIQRKDTNTDRLLSMLMANYQPKTTGQTVTDHPSLGDQIGGAVSIAKPDCCFIFIEANGGKLDPLVRKFRDELMTVRNRRGYCRLAEKLVPWMRKSKFVMNLVNRLMVRPMMKSGRWHIERKGFPVFSHMAGFLWLTVFDIMGFGSPFKRSDGEWV